MSIDTNLLIAAKIIHDECANNLSCFSCQIEEICNLAETPEDWEIPEPPPEPTEQMRIEWLRMLADDEMLDVAKKMQKSDGWWHIEVSLEQFRKDVRLK